MISFPSAFALALGAATATAWADTNPDFDDDAKPILRHQPGLIQYVESRFDVKDTGTAKYPGDDDHDPRPPYIFRARPLGSNGPFNLRLLIQPGSPGHILAVVDMSRAHVAPPGAPAQQAPPQAEPRQEAPVAQQPPQQQGPPPMEPAYQSQGPVVQPQQQPPPPQPAETPAPPSSGSGSAPTSDTPSGPITSDTPSGPIMESGSPTPPSASQPALEPPPDPAPASH